MVREMSRIAEIAPMRFDQMREILPNQRLAAGQPNLVNTQIAHHADDRVRSLRNSGSLHAARILRLRACSNSTGYYTGP